MRYTDFGEVFSRRKAHVAVLSTYEFDPLYFENRLLFSNALEGARRILIFMDGGCYQRLARSDVHARYVNERYLLVPVNRSQGVFHAKLSLLVREDGATLFCGSNNLTQAGCTNNLELVNVIDVLKKDDGSLHRGLLSAAMEFYQGCLALCRGPEKRLADRFLRELARDCHWLSSGAEAGEVRLVHTLTAPLIPVLQGELGDRKPDRMLVVSPFFDNDLGMLKKVRTLWPKCSVDLVAQEQTGNLPTKSLVKFGRGVRLHRIHVPNSRRLHAKLVALVVDGEAVCCSGSANFTTAAFDGRNVEVCLIMRTQADTVDALFDRQLRIEAVKPSDFNAGSEVEPRTEGGDSDCLVLLGASLGQGNRLSLVYSVAKPTELGVLRVAIRRYGDEKAGTMLEIPCDPALFREVQLSEERLKDFQGAVQCLLVGRTKDGSTVTSQPLWLVQESRLTREHGLGAGGTDRERIIRETGRGTTEYLDVLAERDGHRAVIEFLYHLNIKYQSGILSGREQFGFNIGVHDPTTSDEAPAWTRMAGPTLETAIFDFVDRHHRNVLHKHAKRGNINGLANFLDVFVECNKLLFLYHRRGNLRPLFAMEKILRGIGLMTNGYHFLGEDLTGYIAQMRFELSGDDDLVAKTLHEAHASEHVCLALLMAQFIRRDVSRKGRAADYLQEYAQRIGECLRDTRPTPETLSDALNFYGFLSEADKASWVTAAMEQPFMAEDRVPA